MSPEPLIVCRGVSRTYGTQNGWVEALRDVDVDLPAGAITALVGPSGSGKSTLLRVLAGFDPVASGSVKIDGREVTGFDGRELRRHRRETVAFLAQRAASNLIPHLTVRDQLGPAPVPDLGLGARMDARASELSGGEQARAALTVALSRGNPVLLVDEPTAELDRAHAGDVVKALRHAAAEGRAVVVATHDPDLVALVDHRIELTQPHPPVPANEVRAATATGDVVLRADALTKRYDGRPVVDAVSIELRAGELGVLLGRSGSGKSTLLMVAAGFLAADGGSVDVPGLAWTETSYLPQRFGLLPELSIAENVSLPLRLAGRDADAHELLTRLDLAPLADRLPAETSVGQQQRAAVARALAVAPTLLLADEPTSHQDAVSAERVWSALAAARATGTACLIATHDEAAVERADRVWRIEDGRLTTPA